MSQASVAELRMRQEQETSRFAAEHERLCRLQAAKLPKATENHPNGYPKATDSEPIHPMTTRKLPNPKATESHPMTNRQPPHD